MLVVSNYVSGIEICVQKYITESEASSDLGCLVFVMIMNYMYIAIRPRKTGCISMILGIVSSHVFTVSFLHLYLHTCISTTCNHQLDGFVYVIRTRSLGYGF